MLKVFSINHATECLVEKWTVPKKEKREQEVIIQVNKLYGCTDGNQTLYAWNDEILCLKKGSDRTPAAIRKTRILLMWLTSLSNEIVSYMFALIFEHASAWSHFPTGLCFFKDEK